MKNGNVETVEQLRERAVELEFELKRERAARTEAAYLFEGLRELAFAGGADEILAATLQQMRASSNASAAFLLRVAEGDAPENLICVGSTDPLFNGTLWRCGDHFQRVLLGKPVRLFDTQQVAEWQEQPAELSARYRSAMSLLIQPPETARAERTVLVCLSEKPAFFSANGARTAARLAILARDGLRLVQDREDRLRARLRKLTTRGDQVRTQLLISAADAFGEGLIVTDENDRLVVCNDTYRALYPALADRYQPGADVREIFKAEVRAGVVLDAIGDETGWIERWGNAAFSSRATEHSLADGRYVRASSKALPNGWRVGFRLDITALKQQEQQLRDALAAAESANETKSRFLATVSHEIRTPLNAIMGLLGVLSREELAAQQQEYVQAARMASSRLTSLLNDVLDLAKMEAGHIELEDEVINIADLLIDVQRMFQRAADEKGLTLTVERELNPRTTVRGDSGRIRQILVNYVSNAVKFTRSGGVSIRAIVGPRPSEIRFGVIDSGRGIAADELDAVFQPFNQLPSAIQSRAGGTGLGLSIVRELAEAMNGQAWAESTPGKGSGFWLSVILPAAQSIEPMSDRDAVRPLPALPQGLRILAADDSSSNLLLLRALFEKSNVILDCVSDGLEAVELLNRTAYDLVLMDISMPVMDGFEATETIRALEREQRCAHAGEIPIVALTAAVMESDRARIASAGFSGFLSKPVDEAQLIETISRLVSPALLPAGEGTAHDKVFCNPKVEVPTPSFFPESDAKDDLSGMLDLLPPDQRALLQQTLCIEFKDRLELLRSALSPPDAAVVKLQAHAIKGTGASFGLVRLAEIAACVEEDAKANSPTLNWPAVRAFIGELEKAVQGLQP